HEINELLIELVDVNNEKAYAHYAAFGVGSEVEGYALKVLGGYSGDAGDSLKYHAGRRFSTKDLDQDGWIEGNCAQAHSGAWWYRGCDTSNLNGKYLNGELPESHLYQGMYWGEFRGPQYSLAEARMMIRPRDENSSPMFPGGLSKNRKG
ncbi:Angiopoietin-related protein 1, partial [Gonioctena quinquepunctata]